MSIVPSRTNTFDIKKGDTWPRIETVLLDGDGSPIDLTSASSVKFSMALATHPRTIVLDEVSAGFSATTSGAVWYQWVAGNTDTEGEYDIEWTITFPAVGRMTVPSTGYDKVRINRSIG